MYEDHTEKLLAELETAREQLVLSNEQLQKERDYRRQIEESFSKQLRFGKVLAEISARLISLPLDQVGTEIQEAQRLICKHLDIDRSVIWQVYPEQDMLRMSHVYQPQNSNPLEEPAHPRMRSTTGWVAESADPTPGFLGMQADAYFPWLARQVSSGRVTLVSRLDDLPKEAAADREFLLRYGTKSTAVVPLVAGGTVLGCITFASMREERDWPEALVEQLRFIAQIFSNAIARARADRAVHESEEKLILAAASANAGLWSIDVWSWDLWATAKARELFGIEPEERLTFEGFLHHVHPEERERVRTVALQAIESGGDMSIEYRIVHPLFGGRWIASRGRIYCGSQGEPDRLMGVSVDVTERKRMEEQILKAAGEWQTTFDSIHDLMMIMDRDMRVLRVNAAASSFLGLSLEQIIGRQCHTLMHCADKPVAGCPAEKAFASKHHEEMEVFLDGKNTWVLVSADPIQDSAGNVIGLVHALKDISERKRMQDQLEARIEEIEGLKKQLEAENLYLREEVKLLSLHEDIVAKSETMRRVLLQVEQVAPTISTVLITGETGTGKGLIARAIHRLSPRKSLPLLVVNCASLPSTLIESELFGREKGAYTGAMSRMVGRFEAADGGTVFLDEIGELPMEAQAKLLRILEDGCFERLGSTKTVQVNVRLLAATNRNLAQLIQEGKFRSDLYYRLNVFPIQIPPLRERPEDIPLLVWAFVRQFQKEMGKHVQSIPKRSMQALQQNPWPGNARELRNVVEHAMIVSKGAVLEIALPSEGRPDAAMAGTTSAGFRNLKEVERQLILQVLHETKWRVSGKMGAAEILGLKPTTLESRMKKLGIHRSKP